MDLPTPRCPSCNWTLKLVPWAVIYGTEAEGWAAVCPNPRRDRSLPVCRHRQVETPNGRLTLVHSHEITAAQAA